MRSLLLALLTGVLILISFYFFPCLIFFSLIPLLFAVQHNSPKSSFWLGFISGLTFYIPFLSFIFTLEVEIKFWLYFGIFLLWVYLSLYFGVWAFFTARKKLLFFSPFLFASLEFLRSLTSEIGFPWGSLAYSLIPCRILIQFADIVGISGITFVIVLANVVIFYALSRKRLIAILFLFPIFFSILLYGKMRMKEEVDSGIKVGVVQPNIEPTVKRDEEWEYRFSMLDSLSREIRDVDLLIWPETSVPGYLGRATRTEARVKKIVDSLGVPVIMGAQRLDFGRGRTKVHNSAFLFVPEKGMSAFHDKIYLVPFGERLPFDQIFPFLQKLHFGQGDFSPGLGYTIFKVKDIPFCTLVCFESIFPRLVRRFVNKGVLFIVNITDDCWFGRTQGPYEHAEMAVMRAIEYRIPLVRCANTGLSFVVTKTGKVLKETKLFEREVFVQEIYPGDGKTFYASHGDLFAWICLIVSFLSIMLQFLSAKRENK
jgi:apolipoprotein N-acyltransferase